MFRPRLRRVLIIGVASLACALSALPITAGAAFAAATDSGSGAGAAWSAAVQVAPAGVAISDVSCVSTTFCMAVDDNGEAMSYDGTSWSTPASVSSSPLIAVSCASTSFCVASDNPVDPATADTYKFDGSSWTTAGQPALHSPIASIACISSTFCVGVEPLHGVDQFDGTAWSVGHTNASTTLALAEFDSVSCASTTFCLVTGSYGNAFRYDGTYWSQNMAFDATLSTATGDKWTDVSCPSATFCAAVDNLGNAQTYNGTVWSDASDVNDGVAFTSLWCTSSTWCLAVDLTGYLTTYDGTEWASAAPVLDEGDYFTTVRCVSEAFCVVGDSVGNARIVSQHFSANSGTLPSVQAGESMSFMLAAASGTRPYHWSPIGTLPPGLSLSVAGVLSGTPTTPGDYSFVVQVTDSAAPTRVATATIGLHVSASAYHPITPRRLFDTRTGAGGVPKAMIGAHRTIAVKVAGMAGVPANATAVALNVTAVGATSPTFVTVYPAGAARPHSSTLNPSSAAAVANFAMVRVGSGGYIDVYNDAGSVNVLADVQGYYMPGSGYHSLTPARDFDTRTGAGGVPRAKIGAHGVVKVKVTGVNGVPSTATAVALNVTAVGATAATFVTVYPYGSARPHASTLNPSSGAAVANFVIVRVGPGGYIDVYNDAGRVDVLADVQGYFDAGAAYTGVIPKRLFDTRSGAGGVPRTRIGPHGAIKVKVRGVAGVPVGATAVALNITAVGATSPTFITAYPHGAARPHASTVNPSGAAATPNFAMVQIGADGYITIYNDAGYIHVLADVQGYVVG